MDKVQKETSAEAIFKEMDYDTLDQDRAALSVLQENEEQLPFYPYKVAPQTVNTLVASTNVGKSTMTAALANELSHYGKTFILSTEETKSDITARRENMSDLSPLKNIKFVQEHKLTQNLIEKIFENLEKYGYKYIIIDYVNPHNIEIDADLAQKIDIFYQWLLDNAQEHNICVFAFAQSNAKAYNEKIDVLEELTTKPNRVATFTDGGIRAIVKSYSVVYLHLDNTIPSRTMIACKGRQRDVGLVNGTAQEYDVDQDELVINVKERPQGFSPRDERKKPKNTIKKMG